MADWHAGRILFALARYFDWARNHMFTEWEVDGGRADVIFLTRARQLTEVEIKISLADWNADRNKGKFDQDRPHVSRFFYAIPETIQDRIPDWIPESAGIIVVGKAEGSWAMQDWVAIRREAQRRRAIRISDAQIQKMYENSYYRYWRQQMDQWQRRLDPVFCAERDARA